MSIPGMLPEKGVAIAPRLLISAATKCSPARWVSWFLRPFPVVAGKSPATSTDSSSFVATSTPPLSWTAPLFDPRSTIWDVERDIGVASELSRVRASGPCGVRPQRLQLHLRETRLEVVELPHERWHVLLKELVRQGPWQIPDPDTYRFARARGSTDLD